MRDGLAADRDYQHSRMRYNLPDLPPPKLIITLRKFDLLPAIAFVPSRRKCDEAATEVALSKTLFIDREKQSAREAFFEEALKESPEIGRHRHRGILLKAGVASHHAGHLPAWKLVVEKMMSKGLLNAIFATSTVAAGVDFPARTVVVSNADTRGNEGWRPLGASELQQMTGRAGRRGKDNVGFIVLAPGRFQNPQQIAELLESPSDPLESKFRATYSSLLNLLDAFGSFGQVRGIAEKSFAFRETSHKIASFEKKADRIRENISAAVGSAAPGLGIEAVTAFELLTSARRRIQEKLPETRAELRRRWLRKNVVQGRIISRAKKGNRFLLVISVHGDKVVTLRDDGRGSNMSLAQVKRVYQKKYPVAEKSLVRGFEDIYEGKNPIIREPKLSKQPRGGEEAVEIIDSMIDKVLPGNLTEDQSREAQTILWQTVNDASEVRKLERDAQFLKDQIWDPFERRSRVLDYYGYIDFAGQLVTDEGRWLADLRLDRPLLVGEAIKEGLFEKLTTEEIAGFMAAIAADPDRDYGRLDPSSRLTGVLTDFQDVIYDVADVEWNFGVEPADEINLSAAATAESWASGSGWESLVRNTRAEEGDLVRLLSRTGEALMQVARLRDSHTASSGAARTCADLILRDPIR